MLIDGHGEETAGNGPIVRLSDADRRSSTPTMRPPDWDGDEQLHVPRPVAQPDLAERLHAVHLRRGRHHLHPHAAQCARLRLPRAEDHGGVDAQHPEHAKAGNPRSPAHGSARRRSNRPRRQPKGTSGVAAGRTTRRALLEERDGFACPTDDDIIDPKVVLSPIETSRRIDRCACVPLDDGYFSSPRLVPDLPYRGPSRDSVPDHAHWVPTDLPTNRGQLGPAAPNWKDVIVTREVPVSDELSDVIDHLQTVHLSPELRDVRARAGADGPLACGVPVATGGRRFADGRRSSRHESDERPSAAGSPAMCSCRDRLAPRTAPDRVHFQSRGEAVFRAICQNCHGKDADSNSPLAATILELTGGQNPRRELRRRPVRAADCARRVCARGVPGRSRRNARRLAGSLPAVHGPWRNRGDYSAARAQPGRDEPLLRQSRHALRGRTTRTCSARPSSFASTCSGTTAG